MGFWEPAHRSAEHRVVETSEKTPVYLWDCANGSYMRLSPSAYHLLKSVEAGTSFETIATALSQRQGRLVLASEVEAAYQRLSDQIALIECRDARPTSGFLIHLPLISERFVAAAARILARAFHPLVAACLLGVVISLTLVLHQGLNVQFSPADYWIGFVLFVASLVIHEFGHASACARYGARPSHIGLAIYWVYPVFYSDVSAAWRLKRWQRVVVDLGGAYFQAIIAAVYALAYLVCGWTPLKVAIIMIVYSGLFLLNPILKFDGYWVVADALGVTNLGRQPGRILRHACASLRGRSTDSLPWPLAVTGLLGIYTLLTVGFWAYFLWELIPFLWQQLAGYPALCTMLINDLLAPPHLPSFSRFSALLTSTFVVVIAGLVLWRVVQPFVQPVRSLARRVYPGGNAPHVARSPADRS